MTKTISATNDPALTFLVDEEDYDLARYRWDAKPQGYAHSWQLLQAMHQVIGCRMGITGMVDHINRIKTDNRRRNLRATTKTLNGANTGPTKRNTSGYRGVQRQYGRWIVMLAVNGIATWGGSFDTAEEAAVAYDIRAREVYGQYAHCNLPEASPELVARVRERMMSAKQRKGKSRFRGVSLSRHGTWGAQITEQHITYHLGHYVTEEEAARAVDNKILELRLKRRLNLPQEVQS